MKKRVSSVLAVVALAAATSFLSPAVASAAPTCTTTAGIATCTGSTSDGAAYSFSIPSNFNGVFFLWSHGFRNPFDLPQIGQPLNKTADVGPVKPVNDSLLAIGYGIGGSAFPRQGWNLDEAVKTNAELIGVIKAQYPSVKKVVAWGGSLGGIISQGTAEQYPNLVDAVGPLCAVAEGPIAIGTELDAVLFGLKAFFDPTIMGGGYSLNPAVGLPQALGDLQKISAVLTSLQANVTTGAWPATASPAGKALQAAGIPSRSALLLTGLVAGIPTQSAHFDAATGPGNPNDPTNTNYDLFALGVSPALGVLENIASFIGSAVLGRYDAELKAGGKAVEATGIDWASRLGDNRDTYSIALAGDTAIDAMLGVLKASEPLASKADPVARAKADAFLKTTGKVTKPTISMSTTIDPFVQAGNTQWYIDQYDKQYKAEVAKAKAAAKKAKKKYVAPAKKYINFWTAPYPETWTKFTLAGAPDTSFAAPFGVGHCNFSPAQFMAVGYLLGEAAKTGKLPAFDRNILFYEGSGFVTDPDYVANLPFFFRK